MGIDWRELYASNQAQIQAALSKGGLVHLPQGGVVHPQGGVNHLPAEPTRPGALVHVPASLDPTAPAPLVCMLHGCTQDPGTFAAATMMNRLADRHGFVVVYPGQDRLHNALGCWNWFRPEHQRRGTGEPAAIAATVRDLVERDSRFTIDPERVFIAGLSSGGAMALIMALCYPELFAAVAVHSGLPFGSATDMSSAFRVMAQGPADAAALDAAVLTSAGPHARPVPSLVIHGTADRTVSPVNARAVLRQCMTASHLAAPASRKHDVAHPTSSWRSRTTAGYTYIRSQWADETGTAVHELLEVENLGHAWSGGASGGSYTDPRGPSASEAISEFFSLTRTAAYVV
jgi:poly(hydroxyalkanoate) depolymerase family esterase